MLFLCPSFSLFCCTSVHTTCVLTQARMHRDYVHFPEAETDETYLYVLQVAREMMNRTGPSRIYRVAVDATFCFPDCAWPLEVGSVRPKSNLTILREFLGKHDPGRVRRAPRLLKRAMKDIKSLLKHHYGESPDLRPSRSSVQVLVVWAIYGNAKTKPVPLVMAVMKSRYGC